MGKSSKERQEPLPEAGSDSERRRVGSVEHDERGNASMRWHDAPVGDERQVLEILGNPPLAIKTDDSCDPYARGKPHQKKRSVTRTDLRKLSEHIKKMRELAARKRNEPDED